MALVPQVVDAVTRPGDRRGGIGDGRGIAAALALGACGCADGHCLPLLHRGRNRCTAPGPLLRSAADTDTMVTDAISGRSARTPAQQPTPRTWSATVSGSPDFPSLYDLTDPLTGQPGCRTSPTFISTARPPPLNVELPARALLERLVAEAQASLARACALSRKAPGFFS